MKLYNTLSRQESELPSPNEQKIITMYACGPTVYDETHIGHMRKYTMDDILKRSLEFLGHEVKHVMNITDVGHLTGDDDSGDDKLEKGAKKQNKTVEEVAQYYTDKFFETMDALNIKRPHTVMKATDNIQPMINLIKQLQEKGCTYETDQAIYFDVTKFPTYGQLSGQKLEDKKQAVRDDVYIDTQKKHPADFALWFKRVGRFADHTMHWESPWGDGFPGWHIECSAMSMKALGETIDIHTGGIDHIPVHHENEIAQSEAATGKHFVKWWVHHAFLMVDGEKMSKSKGNFYTKQDILNHEINPLAIRFLFLQSHYRKPLNFTWESAKAAQNAYEDLINRAITLRIAVNTESSSTFTDNEANQINEKKVLLRNKFENTLLDDLNTSEAVAVLWEMLKSNLPPKEKINLLSVFDKVFALNLLPEGKYDKPYLMIPMEVNKLAKQIDQARKEKNFQQSDELRKQIEEQGYIVENTAKGTIVKK